MQGIILSVTAAAILAAISANIVGNGPAKEVVRIVGAVIVILALSSALRLKVSKMHMGEKVNQIQKESEQAAEKGKEAGQEWMQAAFIGQIEKYVEDKAAQTGIEISVKLTAKQNDKGEWELDHALVQSRAELPEKGKKAVVDILENDCGLPQIKQQFERM